MAISVFNLFSIGIGPSSSHTVGPMRAARQFMLDLEAAGLLPATIVVKADLYGSLALTGKGHATDVAILLGLEGETPDGIDPNEIKKRIEIIRHSKHINLLGMKRIAFEEEKHLLFHFDKQLPYHPNGMRFIAYEQNSKELFSKVYYSVGGGFIIDHEAASKDVHLGEDAHKLPYPFNTAEELLRVCRINRIKIRDIMMENEKTWRNEQEIRQGLLKIWEVMKSCIERGCHQEGVLPGGLNVQRRAAALLRALAQDEIDNKKNPAQVMEWVSLWALAVNEENAAGGRVVTAPTNGAAGVIPAVLHYYEKLVPENTQRKALLNSCLQQGPWEFYTKMGPPFPLLKWDAWAKWALPALWLLQGLQRHWGAPTNRSKMLLKLGMEHNLGLTCDPIKGLVQIPVHRKKYNGGYQGHQCVACLPCKVMASHRVSLDQVIATMRQTGRDMMSIYKETSQGGLAVNVPEC